MISLLLAIVLVGFAYFSAPLILWITSIGLYMFFTNVDIQVIIIFVSVSFIFLIPPIRKILISDMLVLLVHKYNLLPKISASETVALEAGTPWIDKDLFSGKPDFSDIFSQVYPTLSEEEQSFMDNEVETLCAMDTDWNISQRRGLSEETWKFMKEKKFLGMVIPKEYGGLGFSATGHAYVIEKLSTRSSVMSITTMVPNSLGPAELLLKYGTQEQKDKFLSNLACGKDIPCFALTEPLAGSDATSIQSEGIIKKDNDGIYIEINFEKRYITLGSIATVIGLAFVLKDPNHILGDKELLGITCALIPSSYEGIDQSRRHDPLNVPFVNAPIVGKNVRITMSDIIGEEKGIGKGWDMLMEALSIGRGISLPSTSCGGAKLCSIVAINHAKARVQFNMSISKFEGIEFELAHISAMTYMMDASRTFTLGAIDRGIKPAVINSVLKYQLTEYFRKITNTSMDILGGNAIIRGEKNLLAHPYFSLPVSITVEGANILTRTLMQFGQGIIRAHPFAYDEIKSLVNNDNKKFDKLLFSHIKYAIRNKARSFVLLITDGIFIRKSTTGFLGKIERKLVVSSSLFAFLCDILFLVYGGNLKRKENINGRMGDILSYMFMITASMRRYINDNDESSKVYLEYISSYGLNKINNSFKEILDNLPLSFLYSPLKILLNINTFSKKPSDKLRAKISHMVCNDNEAKHKLANHIYFPKDENEQLNLLERAYVSINNTEDIAKKVKPFKSVDKALEEKVITQEEAVLLNESIDLRHQAVMVDSFDCQDYLKNK